MYVHFIFSDEFLMCNSLFICSLCLFATNCVICTVLSSELRSSVHCTTEQRKKHKVLYSLANYYADMIKEARWSKQGQYNVRWLTYFTKVQRLQAICQLSVLQSLSLMCAEDANISAASHRRQMAL
ncbi:uncharacterized protein LOC126354854 [Schistocerca gregaria]|uniref:uncharacterized protein LOC126354854 n=1 Tax=Schistocerca gregaria TaxID=7010 RepID=UPI00211E07AF|nr:uncharacterized protein LOC126354854 [Schistocerca gregaria]